MKKSRPANRNTAIGRFLLLQLVLLGMACGSTAPADIPVDRLPPYTAEAAELFDDSLTPEIFGVEQRNDVTEEEVFSDLVKAADHIARVRLTTVARSRAGRRTRYLIVLQPLDVIAGPEPESPLEVSVGLASPSTGLLRALDTEAVGKKFIVFLKRYRANGEPVWHFRGITDTADALAAIRAVE